MIYRFILFFCLFLRFDIHAGNELQRNPRKIGGNRYCDFDEFRNNYNATDLLECFHELAADLADRESGRLTNGKSQGNDSTGRQISFTDLLSTFLNNNFGMSHQSSQFPASPTSGYRPSNYPSTVIPGFQLNLLEVLSTISRHDDYKCVPRILCEMASGRLPGRSFGKQDFFELLGRNVFTNWLAKFDVAATSPLLNFARAIILGYSNRGTATACYDAFPKCPRDANALVYYLNNYNGGFFRLFNRFQSGNYKRYNGVSDQRVVTKGRVVNGGSKDYFHDSRLREKIQFPVALYDGYYQKAKFPRYDKTRNNNDITFPEREDLMNDGTSIYDYNNVKSYELIFREQKDLGNVPTISNEQNHIPGFNVWNEDNIPFFPQERYQEKIKGIRFPTNFDLTSTD